MKQKQIDYVGTWPSSEDCVKQMREGVEVLKGKKITGGTKNDTGKPEYDRLDFTALGLINAVHKHGDEKYSKGNWKQGLHFSRLCNAAIRHIASILKGDFLDDESGLPHAAHAACNMEMIIYFVNNIEKYKNYDDITPEI